MEKVLIVDGYNMIGAWENLRSLWEANIEEARHKLMDLLVDYKAATGMRVIIVFDAYRVPGNEKSYTYKNLEIIFTKKNEKADQRIEKLSHELKKRRTEIYVATSDMDQQHVVFGNGALRKSARELELDIQEAKKIIKTQTVKTNEQKPARRIEFTNEQQQKINRMFEEPK